jgi:ribose 5-phosphate isomerase
LPRGVDSASRLVRTNQHIAWARYRLREVSAEIAEFGASSTMRLMQEASAARSDGRNLVVEMRNQVIKELKEAELDLERVEAVLGDFDQETVRIIRANAGLDAAVPE